MRRVFGEVWQRAERNTECCEPPPDEHRLELQNHAGENWIGLLRVTDGASFRRGVRQLGTWTAATPSMLESLAVGETYLLRHGATPVAYILVHGFEDEI